MHLHILLVFLSFEWFVASQELVSCIALDKAGTLYAGTSLGYIRFNGTLYQYFNQTLHLIYSTDKYGWTLTGGALTRYEVDSDPQTYSIEEATLDPFLYRQVVWE
eukprot:TRINITY_DN11466_c0_g1_i1.p1 TRINITY_DN11466_c0_g1~~TRINITY_DN11466_c0_g1_i1.p1  ORF type:complete len:105 (-),score=16.71 TRINITY_DN11466_c0_g1_i1:173-487(-)